MSLSGARWGESKCWKRFHSICFRVNGLAAIMGWTFNRTHFFFIYKELSLLTFREERKKLFQLGTYKAPCRIIWQIIQTAAIYWDTTMFQVFLFCFVFHWALKTVLWDKCYFILYIENCGLKRLKNLYKIAQPVRGRVKMNLVWVFKAPILINRDAVYRFITSFFEDRSPDRRTWPDTN